MSTAHLLTVADAATELGISVQRVRKMISDGRLVSQFLSPRVQVIERTALDAVRVRKPGRPKLGKVA